MADDWTAVADGIARVQRAYLDWLAAKAETRQGSKKYKAALKEWEAALEVRETALRAAYDPEQDDEAHPLSSTLRRFYAETMTGDSTVKRGGKR